jgi:hypothetical protein
MLKKYLKSKYKPKKVMSDKNKSEIKFLVELDENRVPKIIMVRGGVDLEEAKAIMLSVDSKSKESVLFMDKRNAC